MPTTPEQAKRLSMMEQIMTLSKDMAEMTANYYTTLTNNGVPESVAENFTLMWLDKVLPSPTPKEPEAESD